jgi:hypothetical protein
LLEAGATDLAFKPSRWAILTSSANDAAPHLCHNLRAMQLDDFFL